MEDFTRLFDNPRLFTCNAVVGDLYLVLPQPGPKSITPTQAWLDDLGLSGTFVYSARKLGVTQQTAEDFIKRILDRVAAAGGPRGFVWQDVSELRLWTMNAGGSAVVKGLDMVLAEGLRYTVPDGAGLRFMGDYVEVTAAQDLGYTGGCAPAPVATVTQAELWLSKQVVGTLNYAADFSQTTLNDDASWGFQYVYSSGAYWFPLAPAVAGASIHLAVSYDPSLPVTQPDELVRSRFDFTAGGTSSVFLDSNFRTQQGKHITLAPLAGQSSLVYHLGPPERSAALAPVGVFEISVKNATGPIDFMCGLQGTEGVSFRSGDLLTFTPFRPAYAPAFPFAAASPVLPPTDPTASVLTNGYLTSWAKLSTQGGQAKMPYTAQPKGGAQYGVAGSYYASAGVYGWLSNPIALPLDRYWPIAPSAAAGSAAVFEQQVIAPTRRKEIGTQDPYSSGTYTMTTPSGQLIYVTNGEWTRIMLGATTLDPLTAVYFQQPSAKLRQVFETSSLFLVAANGTALEPFEHVVEIGGWRLSPEVGRGNEYGSYRNVMIIKGRPGKLYDPDDPGGSLVSNPAQWTQPDFAVPTGGTQRELVILSQWLQDYFKDALGRGADYDKFNAIASDPHWTGTLFLKVDIAEVPDDLIGILAGVNDPDGFAAHHLGIEVNPVSGSGSAQPDLSGTSSMFALIDYVDPQFSQPKPGEPATPVRPGSGTAYDFTLLSLQVLIVNTVVRRFASIAQLVTTGYFDMPVVRMESANATGDKYRAMVLYGTLQTNDRNPVYSMAGSDDALFYFDNDVMRRVEVTGVTMATRSTGFENKDTTGGTWFALSGYLDFATVRAADGTFDVFSFGAADGSEATRQGLSFGNLGILMTFPLSQPNDRSFSFDASEMTFDVAGSTAREGSLFRQFGLDVAGIVNGDKDTPPSRNGFVPVVTDAQLSGVDGGSWWAVQYRLPMGTAGNLAEQAGLVSSLLTAWSPRKSTNDTRTAADPGSYQGALALQLPGTGGGAKLISLQSVLQLSVGQIWLRYAREGEHTGFLMLFSEIAVNVMGLVKVPPGSTLLNLYGNPLGGAAPSGLGWYAMYRRKGIGQ